MQDILEDVKDHTQTITVTYIIPHVDTKLLHLWEARHSLTKPWKKHVITEDLKIKSPNKQAGSRVRHATVQRELVIKAP